MKNRIIALILVVVMSVLALASCGSYNFATEDLSSYATWADGKDLAAFLAALKKLEIEDDTFTTDEDIRNAIVKSGIYDKILTKIIANTKEADRVTDFEKNPLGAGDVLYFVYYATLPDADGNPIVLFRSEFDPTKVTATNSKIPHMLKLDLRLDEKNDDFLIQLKEALEGKNLNDYTYLTKTAAQLKADAKEALENDEAKIKEIREKAEDDLKKKHETEEKPAPTEAELKTAADKAVADAITAAQNDAVKVQAGKTIVISYTRTHKVPKVDKDGNPVLDAEGKQEMETITETVKFEEITLDPSKPLDAKLLHPDATANIGDTKFNAFISKTEATEDKKAQVTKNTTFDIKDGETTYTYKDVSINWLVNTTEESITPIIIKDYVLYPEKDYLDDEGNRKKNDKGEEIKQEVTVETLEHNGERIDLVGKKLTYHVYPVYAIDAPSYDEMKENNAYELLYHLYGSALDEKDFDVLGEDYKYTGKNDKGEDVEETVKDLLKEITKVFVAEKTVKKEDLQKEDDLNTYYFTKGEDGKLVATKLWTLLEEYQTKQKDAGTATTGVKAEAAKAALEALNEARNEAIKVIIEKIADAKKGDDVLGQKALDEYSETEYNTKETQYESAISKKINQAVWDVITEYVKIENDKIPEKLIKEFRDQIYEYHKYEYYVGPTDNQYSQRHYDTYAEKGGLDAYLVAKAGLGLKTGFTKDELEAALKKAALEDIIPLVKVYFISRQLADVANDKNNQYELTTLEAWLQNKIDGGWNRLTVDSIKSLKDKHGDKYQDAIKLQEKNIKEYEEQMINLSKYFLVDDNFINAYKKEVGNSQYRNDIQNYGEINFRAEWQINNLFNFLTGFVYEDMKDVTDFERSEVKYENGLICFNNVAYTIKVEETEDSKDAE